MSGRQRPAGPPPGPPPGGGAPDVAKVFEAADTNQDGTVSAEEAKALQTKINEARSTLLSIQEKSGTASSSSATDITDLFGGMDTNGDGSVSSAELSSAKTDRTSRPGPPPGPPPSGDTSTSTSDASSRAGDIVKLLDTSGDGTISKDEISLFLQSMTSAPSRSAQAA